jgi:hypothetical protein
MENYGENLIMIKFYTIRENLIWLSGFDVS